MKEVEEMSERKIHVLPDENLGGMLREYVEVKRKAKVGDKKLLPDGTILIAVEPYDRGDGKTPGMWFQDTSGERYSYYNDDNNRLIEPTDIVHIDGQRYRMVERRAEIGETIISLVDDATENHEYSVGDILTVEDAYKFGRSYCVSFLNGRAFWSTDQYRVLEPIEDESITVDESQAHPQVIEMLANLSRRIVALEKKINRLEQTDNSLHRDIETWAQEVERLKGRTKTESSVIKTFNLSEIKTFNLSDLDGRTLHIVVAADTEKESGLTTRVTFGRDVDSGEMFVLGYEVNAE